MGRERRGNAASDQYFSCPYSESFDAQGLSVANETWPNLIHHAVHPHPKPQS